MKKMAKYLAVLAALVMIVGFARTSHALLAAVGPVDPANGFPTFYQDTGGLALAPGLCKTFSPNVVPQIPPTNDPAAPASWMCVLFSEPPFFDDTQPVSFPGNFTSEFFYFIADMVDAYPAGGAPRSIIYRTALEGAFGGGAPLAGDQMVFARIRIRVDIPAGTPVGTYTVVHPYGTEVFPNVGPGVNAINFTRDIGLAPGVFTDALNGDIGPFLRASATTGGAPDPLIVVPPAAGGDPGGSFIGDPNILQKITGSPTGNNFVSISGPAGNATYFDFNLAGKAFTGVLPTPLSVDRVSYRCTSTGVCAVDAFAHSTPDAVVLMSDNVAAGVTPRFQKTQLLSDPALSGRFFGTVRVRAGAAIPDSVVITADNPANGPTSLTRQVDDEVKIKVASYDLATKALTVSAASSDLRVAAPTLKLVGFGDLVAGTITVPNVSTPDGIAIVSSTAGGLDRETVSVIGFPAAVTVQVAAYNGPVTTGGLPQWLISGITKANATVEFFRGTVIDPLQKIGQATADVTGNYTFTSPVPPAGDRNGATRISVLSSAGGQLLGRLLTINP